MKKTILILGIIFLLVGVSVAQSTGDLLNVNVLTNDELSFTHFTNKQIINDISHIKNNIVNMKQSYEGLNPKKPHKNVEDFKGNSWTFYPTDDTYISNDQPYNNYGSNNYFIVGRVDGWFNSVTHRDALINFNLSSIPSGTKIFAKLFIYYYDFSIDPVDREHSIYRITTDWDENTVTWNNQPSYVSTMTDMLILPGSDNVWLEFDVSDDVQSFINGEADNYGWIISDDDEYYAQGSRTASFRSKEHGDFIPYLVVKEPATIYVDDDNTMGPWNGTHEHPYQYIQDGIDNSFLGDTVYVSNGTYYESVLIYEERINLIGESKNNSIIINENKNYVVLVRQRYYGIRISGFTIRTALDNNDGYAGIVLDLRSYNNFVTDNNVVDNSVGIYVYRFANHNYVLNNTLKNNGNDGIYLMDRNHYNFIFNNLVINCNRGIYIEFESSNNIVNNNTITSSEAGICLSQSVEQINVSNNFLYDNYYGIYADNYARELTITRNTVIDNFIGIAIMAVHYCNVSGNFIDNNNCGIYIEPGSKHQLSIYYNNITNNIGSVIELFKGGIFRNRVDDSKIFYNNFINNEPNFKFVDWLGCDNLLYANYWDKPRDTPYIIYGRIGFYLSLFPYVEIDLHPASEPYDITNPHSYDI